MKITSITFRANGPAAGTPYSHVHVEATALVGGEGPQTALAQLKEWVHSELLVAQRGRKDIEAAITLDEKIDSLSTELSELKRMRSIGRARR